MAKIKNGVGMPVKASPSDEIRLRTPGPTMMYGIHEEPDFNPIRDTPVKAPEMKLNHEKQLKRIFALLNAGGEPARITEELAQTIIDDVADMQMSHNGMEDALKHERAETKILSVALSEIYRSLYGYEPTPLFPIEDTMINIRSRIEQLKSGHKHAQYLEQCIRDVHHKLKCPDSDVKDIEALFEEIRIRISSLMEIMKASFDSINEPDSTEKHVREHTESIREIAEQLGVNYLTESVKRSVLEIKAEIERREKDAYIELRQVDKLRIEQDSAKKHILGLTESLRSAPFAGDISSLTLEEAINLLSIALANRLPAKDKEEREKCTKLEREIAQLNYETSKLRFTENSALEKKAESWAVKAIEYRILLSTIERRLRGLWMPEPMREAEIVDAAANTVKDIVDLIAKGIGKS